MQRSVFALGLGTLLLVLLAFGSLGGSHASAASVPVAPVKVMKLHVKGKLENVLTTTKGYTLYWFSLDKTGKTACTSAKCKALWPPLLTKAKTATLRDPKGLTGRFTVVKDALGRQVAYKGHLLYTFTGDKKPGQTNGQGFLNKWWVTNPWVKPLGAPKAKSGGGGSGW